MLEKIGNSNIGDHFVFAQWTIYFASLSMLVNFFLCRQCRYTLKLNYYKREKDMEKNRREKVILKKTRGRTDGSRSRTKGGLRISKSPLDIVRKIQRKRQYVWDSGQLQSRIIRIHFRVFSSCFIVLPENISM